MMEFQLQHAAVIETAAGRMVELIYADNPAPEHNDPQIRCLIAVAAERYPPLPAVHLEALRSVRTVIGDEILRLEQIRGRADD